MTFNPSITTNSSAIGQFQSFASSLPFFPSLDPSSPFATTFPYQNVPFFVPSTTGWTAVATASSSSAQNVATHQVQNRQLDQQQQHPNRQLLVPNQNNNVSAENVGSVEENSGANSEASKKRVLFTPKQVAELEAKFRASQFINAKERNELAQLCGLSATQVKIWFQNKRYKEKRKSKDVHFLYRPQQQQMPMPSKYGEKQQQNVVGMGTVQNSSPSPQLPIFNCSSTMPQQPQNAKLQMPMQNNVVKKEAEVEAVQQVVRHQQHTMFFPHFQHPQHLFYNLNGNSK